MVFGLAKHYMFAIQAIDNVVGVKMFAKEIMTRAHAAFKGRVGTLHLDKFLLTVKASKVLFFFH